jgi:hypothetical protein
MRTGLGMKPTPSRKSPGDVAGNVALVSSAMWVVAVVSIVVVFGCMASLDALLKWAGFRYADETAALSGIPIFVLVVWVAVRRLLARRAV